MKLVTKTSFLKCGANIQKKIELKINTLNSAKSIYNGLLHHFFR